MQYVNPDNFSAFVDFSFRTSTCNILSTAKNNLEILSETIRCWQSVVVVVKVAMHLTIYAQIKATHKVQKNVTFLIWFCGTYIS